MKTLIEAIQKNNIISVISYSTYQYRVSLVNTKTNIRETHLVDKEYFNYLRESICQN